MSLLVLHPNITAVGVEIDAGVIEEARRRAVAVGVADRVELRHADARDLDEEATFDTLFWSQPFFPTESRAAVPAAAWRALKPGGYMIVALLADPPTSPEALRAPEGRAYSVNRLVWSSWGVPVLSASEAQAEVEAAGFEFVRFMPGRFPALFVRRPRS